MTYHAKTVDEYIDMVPKERKEVLNRLRDIFSSELPQGFQESIQYHMMAYTIPHDIYPKGYHVNSSEPLPFISIASQKNHIAIYHLGLYMNQDLLDWFVNEYLHRTNHKLDMGKSCIRFKNLEKIPYDLLKELAGKMTVEDYIKIYEESIKR